MLGCLNHLICAHVSQSCRRNCVVHRCLPYSNPVVRRVVILVKVEVKLKFYTFRVDGLGYCGRLCCEQLLDLRCCIVGSSVLYKQQRISRLCEQVFVSQGFCCMELVMIANCLRT